MLKVATVTLIKEVNTADERIPVLVLCPSQDEKQLFSSADFSAYCFHCLEYSCLQTTPPKLKGKVDLVAFCQDAITYAQVHQIEAVYYSFDIANLVAAVVCQSLNIFGPSIEGVLNCFHKFYAREIDELSVTFRAYIRDDFDSSPLRYSVVQLVNQREVVIEKDILSRLKFP